MWVATSSRRAILPAMWSQGAASSWKHASNRTCLCEGRLNMESVTVGEAPFCVTMNVETTDGCGLIVSVLGGTKPHVGGVAVAIPRMKSSGDGLTADVSQLCVPGHKDVYMAAEISKILAVETGQPVAVTAGVHVDTARAEEISQLMENARLAAHSWITARHHKTQ